jgi:DMSO/TMAO reductase YedYZ molybdopterin-dependent catalytic subunit
MAVFSRGFTGRRHAADTTLPPGQYLTDDFPVLSAGPTPRIATDEWHFGVRSEDGQVRNWSWEQFQELGLEDIHTDIHCVTRWSKLGTSWRGVSLDRVLGDINTSYEYVMASSYGGYTTNVPLADLLDGKAWIATQFDGAPLDPEHGGPARLLVPHLYFWKSAKWVNQLTLMPTDQPGFWEQNGYNIYGDPWQEQRYS